MGSPLGAAKYNSLLQGAASLDRLGTTGLASPAVPKLFLIAYHLWALYFYRVPP